MLFLTLSVMALAVACQKFEPAQGSTPAEAVYNRNCIVCHGKNGGGADGPSLLDRDLTHARIEQQVRTGSTGSSGVMPPFAGRLSADDIKLAADWVAELRRRVGRETPP